MAIGTDVDENVGKIANNMQSLAAVISRFDSSIEPLVKSNSDMITMNQMMVSTNSANIAANSSQISLADTAISTSSMDLVNLQS